MRALFFHLCYYRAAFTPNASLTIPILMCLCSSSSFSVRVRVHSSRPHPPRYFYTVSFPLLLQLYSLMRSSRRSCDCPCKKRHGSPLLCVLFLRVVTRKTQSSSMETKTKMMIMTMMMVVVVAAEMPAMHVHKAMLRH